MYYLKPTLKNLSQGARLEYIRKYRHMSSDDVAEYFGFRGKDPHKTFNSYETTIICKTSIIDVFIKSI